MTFRINAPIDSNQHKGLLAVNSINGNPLALTGLSLTNAQPLHVAIVDGSGSQITTFGGGTQYTDGDVPPAHPIGGTIEWSDGANWQTVSTAKPLPIGGTVGTTSAVVNVGQQTVNTTAVQVSAVSTVPTNGIIIRALAANAANIYVGGSGVTTSNGYELAPGEAVSFTCNLNTLYIRSAASTTDKCCYNVE